MTAKEQMVSVTVESVGRVTGGEPMEGSDVRYNESENSARFMDGDKNRYIVTGRMCFRNGTTIEPSIVGLRGAIEVYRFTPISFNCPTMFGDNSPCLKTGASQALRMTSESTLSPDGCAPAGARSLAQRRLISPRLKPGALRRRW